MEQEAAGKIIAAVLREMNPPPTLEWLQSVLDPFTTAWANKKQSQTHSAVAAMGDMNDTEQPGYPGLEDVPVGPAGYNGEQHDTKKECHWYHLFTYKEGGKPICNAGGKGYDGGDNLTAIRDKLLPAKDGRYGTAPVIDTHVKNHIIKRLNSGITKRHPVVCNPRCDCLHPNDLPGQKEALRKALREAESEAVERDAGKNQRGGGQRKCNATKRVCVGGLNLPAKAASDGSRGWL